MELYLKTDEENDKAAWKRSRAMDHAMHVLTSQLYSDLNAVPVSNSLSAVGEDKLLV